MGIDLVPSLHTDYVGNIANFDFKSKDDFIVVNLAAMRQDFGHAPTDYYERNVRDHTEFLKRIPVEDCLGFIHVGSVACFDGEKIRFSKNLTTDNAYRSTKALQSAKIEKWCEKSGVSFAQLMPSAIYTDKVRTDTNIGKLQTLTKRIAVLPDIAVRKSLTYLPSFTMALVKIIEDRSITGTFLTIEEPVKTVTEIMRDQAPRPIWVIRVPFFKHILTVIATLSLMLYKITGIDLKLYPNRVKKLFSDTSYDWVNNVDRNFYNEASK